MGLGTGREVSPVRRGAVLSRPPRHAAPEPAPVRTGTVPAEPVLDRRRVRVLLLLSLACAALLIAAPLAIVRSSGGPESASPASDDGPVVERETDEGGSGAPTQGTDGTPPPETPAAVPTAAPGLDTAATDGVPAGPSSAAAPDQGDPAPGWPGSDTGQDGGVTPRVPEQGATQPGATPIQILPSKPVPAPAPAQPQPTQPQSTQPQPGRQQPPAQEQPQQPVPQPDPGPLTDAEGVPCPCTLVGGVLVSVSRSVGGVLPPVGGLLGL